MFIKTFICGLWCAIEDFPEDACRVNKLVGHYGDLTSLNWSRWLKYYIFYVVKPAG